MGGDGGRGGHIILKGNPQEWTLLPLRYRKNILAVNGEGGGKNRMTGAEGKDEVLEVPLGTIARDAETGAQLAEITQPGEEVVLLEGGRGGLGNWHFKSASFQTPRFAQPGEPGEERQLILELKLLADVGLVGFPNAGKSTLVSSISAAKPEIADYPFTTLTPKPGMVEVDEKRSFVIADIPGIIEDAHKGRGLGTRFLRHIERNAVLLYTVSCEENNIAASFKLLEHEVLSYNHDLALKQRCLAITKCDLIDDELLQELQVQLRESLPFAMTTFFISGVSGFGLQELRRGLFDEIQNVNTPKEVD